jgi:hypothetical protein
VPQQPANGRLGRKDRARFLEILHNRPLYKKQLAGAQSGETRKRTAKPAIALRERAELEMEQALRRVASLNSI